MELDFSPYNKVGSTFLILRMVALLVSTWFVTIQCSLLSVAPEFKVVTFCDAYLILDWYIKINMLEYVEHGDQFKSPARWCPHEMNDHGDNL